MIEAVIFDWGGTLTPWKTVDAHAAWRAYAGALHADDADRAAEAAPMLAALRARGLQLGILSSTPWPARLARGMAAPRRRARPVRRLRVEQRPGVDQAAPTAFRAAVDAVGVTDPARCVYVGDRPYDDVSGAKGVGMRAVLVPHSDIPPHQQVPVDVSPDGVIARLADLPDLIAPW